MLEETFAYGLVIGCSLFGILWGLVNALLVSSVSFFEFNTLSINLLNLTYFRSEELIWMIIPTWREYMETMNRNLSLITMEEITKNILVPF